MGTYSHEQSQRARAEGIRPPVPSRRCRGMKWWPPITDWKTGDEKRAGQWVECNVGAVAYIPEAAYCANHMPPAGQEVANQRLVLWNELAADLWADVCAEFPCPPLSLPHDGNGNGDQS